MEANLNALTTFLGSRAGEDLKVVFQYQISWGEDEEGTTVDYYQALFTGPQILAKQKKDVGVLVQIHPRWCHKMTETLVRWSFAMLSVKPTFLQRVESVNADEMWRAHVAPTFQQAVGRTLRGQ